MSGYYRELRSRPLLIAELQSNKLFARTFWKFATAMYEVSHHLHKSGYCGMAMQLILEDAIKKLLLFEKEYVQLGRASIWNQSVACMKEIHKNCIERIVQVSHGTVERPGPCQG